MTSYEDLPVLSRNGVIRGRSTGATWPCKAQGCIDTYGAPRQLQVEWDTGDTTRICEVGWELRDAPVDHIRITGGGEISARYVNPIDPKSERGLLDDAWAETVDWEALGWSPQRECANHEKPNGSL